MTRVLFEEDFEDGLLSARGWTDIAKWGVDRSLSIAGAPEVKPISGRKCLKIRYAQGDTGGWMHIRFPKEVREVYCRYYRLFPADWEWPKGYGPHDSIVFAGSYGAPTDTDLSIYLDALVISTEYIGTFEQKGNQRPRARFEYARAWQSMTVDFDGGKSSDPEGGALRYQWDFGDGRKDAGPTVSHTYEVKGSYKVVLTGELYPFKRRSDLALHHPSCPRERDLPQDGKPAAGRRKSRR